MLFTQSSYFPFLLAVFFSYWLIAARASWPTSGRTAYLCLVSYGFYAVSGWLGVTLLLTVSSLDYVITQRMYASDHARTRKRLLWLSLSADLGVLCLFKYANFFAQTLNSFGLPIQPTPLRWLAPLGLSFFLFQSIALVVDVYHRAAEPARSWLEHLTFIAFFPTLIAGPILRASQFLPQLREAKTLDAESANKNGSRALWLILLGLIKKIAIADYLRTNLVERVFDFPERYSALEVLAGVYGYALQIYADFSGYSDIAIGSALLLGFTLPANFNAPYRATDLPDFWRRWHISLSTWLRDYVFFSIAGVRARSTALLYAASFVTMLIGGLWHGAAWTFIAWGALHGFGLIAVRWWQTFHSKHQTAYWLTFRHTRGATVLSTLITFHFVCLTWIFFRAETFAQAATVLRQLSQCTVDLSNLNAPLICLIVIGLLTHWLPPRIEELTLQGFTRLPAPAQALLLFGISAGLYAVASSDLAPFIYSRF